MVLIALTCQPPTKVSTRPLLALGMLAPAEGQLVDEAGDVGDGQVVVGLRVVGADVVAILRRGRVAFERGAGVVERVLPGKGVEQGEAADEALLIVNLQRVVVRIELVQGLGDVRGPVGVRDERSRPTGFFWLALRKPCSLTPWLPT